MTTDELCFTPATTLGGLFARGKVSPLEVMQAVLERIERINPRLNAYCTVAAEQALDAARKATSLARRRISGTRAVAGVKHSSSLVTEGRAPFADRGHRAARRRCS